MLSFHNYLHTCVRTRRMQIIHFLSAAIWHFACCQVGPRRGASHCSYDLEQVHRCSEVFPGSLGAGPLQMLLFLITTTLNYMY